MKHTAICWLAFFLVLGNAVAASERTVHFPFYGEQPLRAGQQSGLPCVTPQNCLLEKKACSSARGWHRRKSCCLDGAVNKGQWHSGSSRWTGTPAPRKSIVLVSPIAAEGGGFLLYKFVDVDKLWFFGELPTTPPQARQVNVNFSYDGLKNWKKGQWHQLGSPGKWGVLPSCTLTGLSPTPSKALSSFLNP